METLVLVITTRCSHRCPGCCIQDLVWSGGEPWDATEDDVLRVAEVAGTDGRVVVTGGDPLAHPRFAAVAAATHRRFRRGELWCTTNGVGALGQVEALRLFDVVSVSVPRTAPASLLEEARGLPALLPGVSVAVQLAPVHSVPSGRSGKCERYDMMPAFFHGRVWPCCAAFGVAGAESVPLGPSWREDVASVPRPCSRCALAR